MPDNNKIKNKIVVFGCGIVILMLIGGMIYNIGGVRRQVVEGWEPYDTDASGKKLNHQKCTTCRPKYVGKRVAKWKTDVGETTNCLMPNSRISGDYKCESGEFVGIGTKSFGEYGSSQPSDTETVTTNNTEFNNMWVNKKAADEVVDSITLTDKPATISDKVVGADEAVAATHLSTASSKTTASTAAPVVPLRFCSKCGNRLHGSKKFCSYCGASTMI